MPFIGVLERENLNSEKSETITSEVFHYYEKFLVSKYEGRSERKFNNPSTTFREMGELQNLYMLFLHHL